MTRSDPSPPRHAQAERTKAAILASARSHFARQGYAGATIRAIAADAHIDPSMVMRYFTDKRTLFTAALDIDLGLADLGRAPLEDRGRQWIEVFLDRWSDPPDTDPLRVLLISSTTDPQAAQRVRTLVSQQIRPIIAATAPDADTVDARTGLAVALILGLVLTRNLLVISQAADITREQLIGAVGPVLQGYLHGPLS